MPDEAVLAEEDVRKFVQDWYDLLDVHAPVSDILPLMTDDVEFRFPEVTTVGKGSFTDWYDRIVHTFFDEVHTLQSVDIAAGGTEVKVLVRWEASVWRAPVAKSERIKFLAGQTWTMGQSADGKPVLKVYSVDSFDAIEGSANLPVLPREVIAQYYNDVDTAAWDKWVALMDDNVVVDEQISGHMEGAAPLAGIGDFFKAKYSKFQMYPQHIVADGEQVAVVWHCEAANAAGVPIDAIGANYFQIKDGKITYMRTIHDTVPFKPFIDEL